MTAPIQRPATREGLLLWVLHRFAEELGEHAVLKGELALRLFDSERLTNDIDFVFVPYNSKKDVLAAVEPILAELTDATVELNTHSTMVRASVTLDDVTIDIEVSVAPECRSTSVATSALASAVGQPSQVVRIMEPSVALAHKLAAWNERRIARDLYDAYFFVARMNVVADATVLDERLSAVRSRLPALRSRKKMTRRQLADALRAALDDLDDDAIVAELGGLLRAPELAGLARRIAVALRGMLERQPF